MPIIQYMITALNNGPIMLVTIGLVLFSNLTPPPAVLTVPAVVARVQTANPLPRIYSYDVADGGVWRQDNADFTSGSSEARYWLRVIRWGLGRDVILADAYAVFADGRCEHILHSVYRWDQTSETIRTSGFVTGGLVIAGKVDEIREGVLRTEVEGTLPDGSLLRMRDTADRTRSSVTITTGERWDGSTWVATGTARWERTGANTCASSI